MAKLLSLEEYEREATSYYEWLSWTFGLSTFLLCITTLQFKSPWKIAVVGLLAIIPMFLYAAKKSPPSLAPLKQLAAEGNEEAIEILGLVLKKFHSLQIAMRMPIVWLSMLFYLAVLYSSFLHPFALLVLWLQS